MRCAWAKPAPSRVVSSGAHESPAFRGPETCSRSRAPDMREVGRGGRGPTWIPRRDTGARDLRPGTAVPEGVEREMPAHRLETWFPR